MVQDRCDSGGPNQTDQYQAGSIPAAVIMKRCSKCKISKEPGDFHKDSSRKDGLRSDCKECSCLSTQKYRDTDAGKKAVAEAKKKYGHSEKGRATIQKYQQSKAGKESSQKAGQKYEHSNSGKKARLRANQKRRQLHPEKEKARNAVNHALRDGRLTKKPCHCGETIVEGHHWSYLEEYWLDIEWLCRTHHNKLHKRKHNG